MDMTTKTNLCSRILISMYHTGSFTQQSTNTEKN
jgi:hypothetical protein